MTGTTISSRVLGAIAPLAGILAISLLTAPYYLFPHLYVPKAKSYLGYLAPASVEGWAFLVSGIILLCVTVFLVHRLHKNSIIR
jgi:hypothetical protein